jgi:hypothetical protein
MYRCGEVNEQHQEVATALARILGGSEGVGGAGVECAGVTEVDEQQQRR